MGRRGEKLRGCCGYKRPEGFPRLQGAVIPTQCPTPFCHGSGQGKRQKKRPRTPPADCQPGADQTGDVGHETTN